MNKLWLLFLYMQDILSVAAASAVFIFRSISIEIVIISSCGLMIVMAVMLLHHTITFARRMCIKVVYNHFVGLVIMDVRRVKLTADSFLVASLLSLSLFCTLLALSWGVRLALDQTNWSKN